MQTASADPLVPKPIPENSGISEGLQRSHLNNEVLETFAQNITENIIQSLLIQMEVVEPKVDCVMSKVNQNQEMLAEGLASAVVEDALREVSRGLHKWGHLEGFQSSRLADVEDGRAKNLHFMDESERESDLLDMDTEIDQGKEIQTSKDIQHCHPPLSHSGLPVVGSLDYPDAPPTTPLLPELQRSRRSFAKKLKGGLANVFLPSPPPPTPKEEEDNAVNKPEVELMEHLLHSLSTDDLARDRFEGGARNGAKMEAFAEDLSCDIIDWVLSARNRKQITDDSSLHLLAHQLAETIITSSLDEAKMLV